MLDVEAQDYHQRLSAKIAEAVHNPTVLAAFRAVPRHLFLKTGFYMIAPGTHQSVFVKPDTMATAAWLDKAYRDEALTTVMRASEPVSSSSQPTLMAQMLNDLEIQAGMRVLEIGTGTGYNAALLAHIVGEAGQVATIDIQPNVTALAEPILQAMFGDRIRVYTGDGLLGVPQHAPYDRIIVTGRYTSVAPAWVTQLQVGGKVLMNMGERGALLLLEKGADGATGRLLNHQGYFMPLVPNNPRVDEWVTGIDMAALNSWDFFYFCTWMLPQSHVWAAPASTETPDTSGMHIHFHAKSGLSGVVLQPDGEQVRVVARGDSAFSDEVLAVVRQWLALGKPGIQEYQLDILPDGQQLMRLHTTPPLTFVVERGGQK